MARFIQSSGERYGSVVGTGGASWWRRGFGNDPLIGLMSLHPKHEFQGRCSGEGKMPFAA